MNVPLFVAAAAAVALLAACSKPPEPPVETTAQPPTNRIDVPPAVRNNLGITFVKVERRRVAVTLRAPGSFELLPGARREHRAAFAGRVDIVVQPLQAVAAGDVLYVLDAPGWRQAQRELGTIDGDLEVARAHRRAMQTLLEAQRTHEQSLKDALAVAQERLRGIEATQQNLGGQAQSLADARVLAAQLQAQIAEAAEQHTETATRIARLDADERAFTDRRALALAQAAAALDTTVDALTAADGDVQRWRRIATIPVRATAAGVVEQLPIATGGWVGEHDLVLTTIDPHQVRFHARALQSDAARLRDGLPARITAAGAETAAHVSGALQLGASGDAQQRTLDLFVVPTDTAPFVRPGIAGFVAIETDASAVPELAIPREAVLPDGLRRVFFRRDPDDPDKVIRVDADLGLDDGRWVEVKSGVVDGDEVVLAGAYELVLASSASVPKGGHFHADGTWHEGEHK
jgi:multidrug resistance efflux pump